MCQFFHVSFFVLVAQYCYLLIRSCELYDHFFHTHTFNLWSGSIFFSQFEYVPFGLSPTELYDHLFHRGILDSCDWLLVDYGILLGYAILIILQCNDVHVFSTAYVSWTKLREESYSVLEYRESTTLEIATKIYVLLLSTRPYNNR